MNSGVDSAARARRERPAGWVVGCILRAMPPNATPTADVVAPPFAIERYKYILQQIHEVNANVYRFLALYQTLSTAVGGAALWLFVNYRGWEITPDVARAGFRGLLLLQTAVAVFVALLVFVGILTWLDYRREECELTEVYYQAGFRKPPRLRNFYRWYETYVLVFILGLSGLLWYVGESFLVPRIV
jgi:hypothetical protein